jgi:hypothetical protein
MRQKARPVEISLRKMGLYRNHSETPLTDWFQLFKTMKRISDLEKDNQELKNKLHGE